MFQYAFHEGVQFVILTDGQEWDFFLPAEQGDYAERRVYKLNIIERDLEECVSKAEPIPEIRINRFWRRD